MCVFFVDRSLGRHVVAVDIRAGVPLRVLIEEVDGLAAGDARRAITGLKGNVAKAELR